jgi:opacity protein-like surface antigen
VRKKLIALLSIFALLLAPSLVRASAADIIDEQVYSLDIPTKEAGWAGAFVDDSSVNKFSNYLLGLDEKTRGSGVGKACDDFNSTECAHIHTLLTTYIFLIAANPSPMIA